MPSALRKPGPPSGAGKGTGKCKDFAGLPQGLFSEPFINDALSPRGGVHAGQPYARRQHLMKPLRIAIAEDNWLVAEYLCGELALLGHAIVGRARTGEELINLVAHERPDLVLADVRLAGGSDGLAAAKEVQERFDVPVQRGFAQFAGGTIQGLGEHVVILQVAYIRNRCPSVFPEMSERFLVICRASSGKSFDEICRGRADLRQERPRCSGE